MKLLLTSGGTTEAIDSVRGITNHSTGQLGKEIAERFLAGKHEVTLVTTNQAVKPAPHPNLTIHLVSNVDSLIKTLEPLVKTHDVLIHSMAVSDYTPVYMTDFEDLKTHRPEDLLGRSNEETKISSASDYQVLFLKKTPKVIRLVKQWNPNISLIGFKLLVNVSKEDLISVARASLTKTSADLIVANDLNDITPSGHRAYLVSDSTIETAISKPDIADKLYERITSHD